MKFLKFVFAILIVTLFVTEPPQAFVFNTGLSQAAGSDVYSLPSNTYNPDSYRSYVGESLESFQTGYRNFSSLPKHYSSQASFFSSGYRGRTGRYDTQLGGTYETTETPEPATLILFGASLAGVGIYRRFKK